jgi:hypothetical protein
MYKRPIVPLIVLLAVFFALPIYSEINEWNANKGQIYYSKKQSCIGEPKTVIAQTSFKHTAGIYKEPCQSANVFDQKDQKIDDPNS